MTDNIGIPQDIELWCCECNHPFIFSAGEQRFYNNKGLQWPKRCRPCRELRKATIARTDAAGLHE